MATRNILVELAHTSGLEENTVSAMSGTGFRLNLSETPQIPLINYDPDFAPVMLPKLIEGEFPEGELFDTSARLSFDDKPETSTYVVRATVEEEALPELMKKVKASKSIVNIFSDIAIQPMIVCPGSPPVGTDADVERLLCTQQMRAAGMDGLGVLVAVVDTGVNMAYLNAHGKTPTFDAARSWAWNPAQVTPGSAPVDHGTMCAFDVCIAAPNCTIIDIALLHGLTAQPGGTLMSAFLSDAIRAYNHLLTIMQAPSRPGDSRSLVVSNSWGMFHPSWDFPVGHFGNYSHNPNHPFTRLVATLERAGADILFAAGNCGADCPDGRCKGVTTRTIYGANSSAHVLSIAGVDTTQARVGYSAIGPGCLTDRKPDVSGYTHFRGSGVYAADGGTSAACPVVSGVVAALRSSRPYNPADTTTSPSAIRNLITSTATDLGASGYDYQHGYGVVNSCNLIPKVTDICKRYPWICKPPFSNLCKTYPWLCQGDPPRILSICKKYPTLCKLLLGRAYSSLPVSTTSDLEQMLMGFGVEGSDLSETGFLEFGFGSEADMTTEESAFYMGYLLGQAESSQSTNPASKPKKNDCGCEEL